MINNVTYYLLNDNDKQSMFIRKDSTLEQLPMPYNVIGKSIK